MSLLGRTKDEAKGTDYPCRHEGERAGAEDDRNHLVHHEVDVSLSCDSLLTVPSARLRSCSPVIECAFINKRSGAKLGDTFLKVLDEISDVPVHNLDEEDPEELIKQYMSQWVRYPRGAGNASFDVGSSTSNSVTSHVESGGALLTPSGSMSDRNLHVIMACGGDGTFSWIASQAVKNGHDVMSGDEASPSGKGDSPGHGSKPSLQYCVIPFPLGTGNDMSGVLGWGRSLNCDPGTIRSLLCSVEESTSGPKCDVWGVNFKNFNSLSRFNTMCNYFSIGVDAKASVLFERHRTSRPMLYRSQSFNKASYAALGGILAFKGSSSLGKRIKRLVVDGVEVDVPRKAKALVVLNIPSYADGTKPWNAGRKHTFREAAIDDGMVEVFCLKSILSIALLKIVRGVFSGGVKRLAQGRNISIEMHPNEVWMSSDEMSSPTSPSSPGSASTRRGTLFAQVDGEAFEFQSSSEVISISRKGSVPTLFGPLRGKSRQGPPAKLKSGSFQKRWPKK